jgi:mycothiol synthase
MHPYGWLFEPEAICQTVLDFITEIDGTGACIDTKNDDLTFRNLQDERDYPLLLELNRGSRQADGEPEPITLEVIAHVLANQMDGLTAQQGVVIASLEETPIGYSRLGWYSSRPETRLYYQISFLPAEGRQRGWWPRLVAENECRLRVIAAGHPPVPERYFQAWASDRQKDWIAVLQSCDYHVVRRFINMLYPLGEAGAPVKPLPSGLEIHPITPENIRAVWEAQKEMNAVLFENVAEDWLDEKYPDWLANPENNPRFWQVAWDGDQLAGMVLAHLNEQENEKRNRQRGYTEHIYVRPQWRGRGLASALIARSLQVLKEQGMTEAELGVDAENESAAFHLYESLGYKTFSIDTWFRKIMFYSTSYKLRI